MGNVVFKNIFFCFWIFPFSRPYLTISGESRFSDADDKNKDYPTTIDDHLSPKEVRIGNETSKSDDENDDIQFAASGITVPLSKSLANFQDSKEIMMTSDSESDYKFSSTNNVPSNTAHVSPCPQGELRCVNGRCITLSQLCDKVCSFRLNKIKIYIERNVLNTLCYRLQIVQMVLMKRCVCTRREFF